MMKEMDIMSGVEQFAQTQGSMLVDVRSAKEYDEGHIAGSVNVPLQELQAMTRQVDRNTPLFLYCLSGGRSKKAALALETAGYVDVTTIGGIQQWTGPVEKKEA